MQEEVLESVANVKQFSRKWVVTRSLFSGGSLKDFLKLMGMNLKFPQLCGYECNTGHVHLHRHRQGGGSESILPQLKSTGFMIRWGSYHGQRLVHGQELGFYSKCFMKPLSDLSRGWRNPNYIFKGQKLLNIILANPL